MILSNQLFKDFVYINYKYFYMNKKVFRYAELVHDNLCIKSNCYLSIGYLRSTDYIVCIDDDAKSALEACKLAYQHKKLYGYFPIMLCVGGKGLMSRWTHKTTEGRHLANICLQLGIPKENIVVLDKGMNNGANIVEINNYIQEAGSFKKVVFACTKRLSLRLMLTQQKQAPELEAYYFVVEGSMFDACRWYNGKRLGNCEMMFHELASILDRCEAYAGTFQAPIPFEIKPEVRKAANYLAKRYRLKMPRNFFQTLRAIPQFIRLYRAIQLNEGRMQMELDCAIELTQQKIRRL